MKTTYLIIATSLIMLSCQDSTQETDTTQQSKVSDLVESTSTNPEFDDKLTTKEISDSLKAKGFEIFEYVDPATNDTIIMQQYYMAFLKRGVVRNQNEEEAASLQDAHMAHLTKMYELGYADISGPFGDDGDIRGVTIYNVPTLELADSLAKADPMVKAGRLEIEIHPWWAAKGYPLR